MRAVERFDINATIPEVLETMKTDVWMQTTENNTTLPTMDYLVPLGIEPLFLAESLDPSY